MNYLIIYLIMVSSSSYMIKPKFCINCKHFIPPDSNNNEYGMCSMFKNIDQTDDFLVTSIKSVKKKNYIYCSIAREFWYMCGKIGRKYEEK